MHQAPRFAAAGLLTAALLASPLLAAPVDNAPDLWPILRQQAFGDRPIAEEDGAVVLEAPMTALDAAIVPITVRIPPSVKDRPKSLTLFIDQNPDPKVATLTYGPAAGSGGERSFNTRVRIERFSHVRASSKPRTGRFIWRRSSSRPPAVARQ
ncbi:MAG: hypothetical protein A49_09770 [Methyloceanibacter sp.]|nr:MAG: hypothetical protein A49_09770 [Methyloceanibacter sp.]